MGKLIVFNERWKNKNICCYQFREIDVIDMTSVRYVRV